MDPNECPMCDAGTVTRWRVRATDEVVQVCNECDSLWDGDGDSTEPAVTTVDQFLAARGLPLLWSGLVPAV
jgi:hypothetical protein